MTQVSSLYLHVPFCKHLCNYCDFYKRGFDRPKEQIEEFHQFLRKSWIRHERLLADANQSMGELDTVYLGGGTPSLWGIEGAKFFRELGLTMKPDAEFTMEVDPGAWTLEMIEAWKALGMNRISIGTQTLNPEFLSIMDRAHTLDESLSLLKFCQENAWNFSLDFLLGIPYSLEKKRNIQAELELLLSYNPSHISLYILNARSKYPHSQNLPEDEYIREEYLFVSEFLRSKGFSHYEVSNFARPGKESVHNLKYWRGESVAAIGPTGTGYLALEPDHALRYKWKVTSAEVEIEDLKHDELLLEETYLSLRISEGWKPRVLTSHHEKLFEQWQSLSYGNWDGEKMKLNSLGFLMLDSLMDDLFRLPSST